jgi:hypothetical protein
MARLPRRKVPDSIGLKVALRQLGIEQPELDHDPALSRRDFDPETGKYTPDEHNPDFLVWRDKADHKIKTFGTKATTRGSDIGERAHERRVTKKEAAFRARLLAKATGTEPSPKKYRWPKRPMRQKHQEARR